MERNLYSASANRACSLLYSYIKEHASGVWLLPVNVCPDVPLTFCLANVPYRFIDIDKDTLCIDIELVEKELLQSPSDYAGVLFVRTYGVLKDTSKLFERIKTIKKDLLIIDDRCLCIPERNPEFWNADMLLYSTGHCKQIDLNGGGLAFYKVNTQYHIDKDLMYDDTDEEAIYKKAFFEGKPLSTVPKGWLKMSSYISTQDYFAMIEGVLPMRVKQRNLINDIYSRHLPLAVQMEKKFQTWRFNIVVPSEKKSLILEDLFGKKLFASSHYRSANRLFDNATFPVSDSLSKRVINLFNDKHYSTEKALMTCEIINNYL